MREADRDQARYLDDILGGQRAKLEELLDALHKQAMELTRIGDQAGLRSTRRVIRVLETEAHMIEPMLKALRNRLGPN